jgi:hypothetical protein
MSILFTNLNIYLQHISFKNMGIYILKNSNKKELFTCGNHINLQNITDKTCKKHCGCKQCSGKQQININFKFLIFSFLSVYICHISNYTKSLFLTKGSGKKELFTCGNHTNLQQVSNKTGKLYSKCKQCLGQKITNVDINIISTSILLTNLNCYIQHISQYSASIILTNGSNKKELFTCGNHTNLQQVSNKSIKNYKKCNQCLNRKITTVNILTSSLLFTNLFYYNQSISNKLGSIFFTKGSSKKQLFTCGKHVNLQTVGSKTINSNGCKQCVRYRSEETCRECIEELTNYKFPNIKQINWLINPKTNRNMEIDCYNEELKLGIEYNDHITKCHKKQSDEKFIIQKERDLIKQKLCKQNKILLLYVPLDYNYKNKQKMKDYIKLLLINNNKKDLLKTDL